MAVYKTKEKTKDGRQWYYSKMIDGKRVKSKRFATKREAEKAESLLIMNSGKADPVKITFGQVATMLLKQKEAVLKPTGYKKLKQQIDHILHNLNDVEIAKMTISDYERMRSYLDNKGFSISYKNKILVSLKSLCHFSELYYNVTTNVPDKFERYQDKVTVKEEMKYYTLSEFNQFISIVDDLRYKAFFTVLFFCGLRCGEANALKWSDIDLQANTLRVNKTVTTKMRDDQHNYLITSPKTKSSIRVLPLANAPKTALKQLYNQYIKYPHFCSDWFVFGGLTALPESTIQKMKNRYVKLSGVKNIRVHDFRHSCASLLINNGANITLVSKYLGHSNISMTLNIYSHFYKSKMEELVDTINDLTDKK